MTSVQGVIRVIRPNGPAQVSCTGLVPPLSTPEVMVGPVLFGESGPDVANVPHSAKPSPPLVMASSPPPLLVLDVPPPDHLPRRLAFG